MTRIAAALIAIAVTGMADDAKKAKAKMDSSADTWKVFLVEPDKLSDDDLRGMANNYDAAIDLLNKLSEKSDNAAADSNVLRLAKRTAQIRATIWSREMRRKAEDAAKRKDEPKAKPVKPAKEPPPVAVSVPAPEIAETKKERSANIRRLRRFAFEYFRHQKPRNIRHACNQCNGAGFTRRVRMVDGARRPYNEDCRHCGARGYYFSANHARRAFWLTRTPMARRDDGTRAEYDSLLNEYTERPKSFDPMTRLVINSIDYRGLWAVIEWTATRGKHRATEAHTVIRLGRAWYFYSPEHDSALLGRSKPEEKK